MNAELRSPTTAPANSPAGEDFGLLINGQLVAGAATLNVINPATENIVAVCPRADLNQLNQAVAAAKAAFASWKNVPIEKRRGLVGKLADALESRMAEFARLLTQEQGKPLPAAMHEIGGAVAMIRAFAAMDLKPEVLRETDKVRIVRQRSPLGVVAAITPWNFPVVLLMLKVPPALVAGNTVVVKPAPTTPLTTLRFGEICAEVLPPGVVNVIVDQNDLGGALTSHPDVAKVAFTGSTATGRKVMASVAPTLKHVTLELGGNDAAIVLDDVDPKEVAPKLFMGAMLNSGQICLAIKRAYVPDSMYEAVCSELGRLAERAIVGNGLEEGTEFGPIQNRMQYEKVKGYLEDARRNGKDRRGRRGLQGPRLFRAPDNRARHSGRCGAGARGAVRPDSPGAALFESRRCHRTCQRHRVRPGRHGLVLQRAARVRGRQPPRSRHGVGEQTSGPAAGHPVRRRQAIRSRYRDGTGRPRGVHAAARDQHREVIYRARSR